MDNHTAYVEEVRIVNQNTFDQITQTPFQTNNISLISAYIDNSMTLEEELNAFMANQDYANQTELCSIMSRHGSDKGGIRKTHNYTTLYSRLFHKIKTEKVNVFELGIGTTDATIPFNMGQGGIPGASLYGWEEYFTNGRIYGADIDSRILFNTDRIKTFYCDQFSETLISEMWSNPTLNEISFDIIIDDGFHAFESNLIFLENSLCKLKAGGLFIIEDLYPETVLKFNLIKQSLIEKYHLQGLHIFTIPIDQTNNNTLLIVLK